MRHMLLLPLMALMLSCSFIAGQGSNATGTGSVDYDAPADPLNVTVVLNEADSVRGVISPEGGEIAFTSLDGSQYLLQVPQGALDAETEIEMTSVQSLDGVPLTGPVFAVQLEPSGLIFNKLATLTILPSTTIPIEEQLVFNYEGSGNDFHRALIDPESSEIHILLTGFSGHGVTTADMANWRMGRAESASIRLKDVIGTLQAAERNGLETKEVAREAIDRILDKFEEDVLGPAMEAATEDCSTYGKYEEIRRTYGQLAGLGSEDRLSGIAPSAETRSKLDRCRTFRANGVFGPSSLDGIVKIGAPFELKVTGLCPGTMNFSGGLRGAIVFSCTFDGKVVLAGSGTYTITLTEGGGMLRGSASVLAQGVPGDATENETFFVTLQRINQ